MTIQFNPDAPRCDAFKVPDRYFDALPARVMARIPEVAAEERTVRRPLWHVLRPYLSAAAVVAVVALGTKAIQQREPAAGYGMQTQSAAVVAEENIQQDELYSYLMVDDHNLYPYSDEQ
ncbi:MAG: hypothetical protein IJS89_06455 [Bacteroidaceae bacterium]|nr:hypothetical protein [Bacteroidaceae bacterium]